MSKDRGNALSALGRFVLTCVGAFVGISVLAAIAVVVWLSFAAPV